MSPPPSARSDGARAPAAAGIVAAFGAVYLIWGSTYLAIRFAIETLPPFLMAGVRFTVAGTLLFAWTRALGKTPPRGVEWRTAAVMGALMLLGGNGAVVWATERVPSGIVALLIATVPLWMVLLDWAQGTGLRPTARVLLGLAIGFGGAVLLVGPDALGAAHLVDPVRGLVALGGALSWAAGSVYARRAPQPASPLVATAAQMLLGGVFLLLLGFAAGEGAEVDPAGFSTLSVLSLAYLILFGAVVGYSAYVWLLRVTSAARVATYAYVNPAVAVFLGWLFADEPLTPRVVVAAAVIVAGVAVITTERTRPATTPRMEPAPASAASGGRAPAPSPDASRDPR